MKRKSTHITDKQRLDWLSKKSFLNEDIHKQYYLTVMAGYVDGSQHNLRSFIDAAMLRDMGKAGK